MADNYSDFMAERNRRKSKVFFRLSKILKKRTPDQCRSHHQKLQIKFKDDLPTIMNEVYKKIQKSMAEEIVNDHCRMHQLEREKMCQLSQMCQMTAARQVTSEFKTLVEESWFSIQSSNETVKLSICTDNLQEW